MKIGIIGAGAIAQAFASQAMKAGHEIVLSNSRGIGSLSTLVSQLGSGATAGTVSEAAQEEIVVLSVPWRSIPKAVAGLPDFQNRIVIDTTNPLQPPDFKIAELGGKTSSQIVAELVPGARVVKAFNTLPPPLLKANPRETGGRRVIFISGDDSDAKQTVGHLIETLGFTPIDLGSLATGGLLQQFPGGSVPTLNLIKLG